RRLGGGEPVPGAGHGHLGQSRPELADRLLVGTGHGPEQEHVQVVELAPHLSGRAPAAQARGHEFAPAAHDFILVVAHIRRHPLLAAMNVHGCVFLYIRWGASHVPPNSTSGLTVPVSRHETGPGNTILGANPFPISLWERRVAELRFSMETHGTAVVVSAQGE